ncbi:hypothetical protein SI65_07997 [Aspergillus cristatus]|uniref:3-oxoacyl-[acyl-carrier-protein] reductase FabG n=1 Tax=Aspergillus cristatus TaxID=573508 RepID=A0A1E3B6A0_ASPCR|nr:hypothetical protein SI65_07997 [Aspergillus cristatus]
MQLMVELEPTRTKPKHNYSKLDVLSSTECTNLIAKQINFLDYLFNCVSINPTTTPITDTTDDYFTKLIDTNLRGTFNTTRACIPCMHPGSAIVNVSSICGLQGLTKTLAAELGPKGIRVNAVAPGPTDTQTFAGNVKGSERMEKDVEGIALGRLGRAEEVADVVVFLFREGSSFVNGGVWEVHGGMK